MAAAFCFLTTAACFFLFWSSFTLSERELFFELKNRAEFWETSLFTGMFFTIAGVPAAIAWSGGILKPSLSEKCTKARADLRVE